MACPIQLSMAVDCADNVGGVKKLFLAVFPDNNLSYSPTIASGVITAWAGAAAKFFTYSVRQGVATGGSNSESDGKSGATSYTPTFSTQVEGITAAKNVELDSVIKNRLLVIVQLQDDTYWLMGYKNGMNAKLETNPGVGMSDFKGYKINGTGAEAFNWYQVTSALIPTISA